MYIEIVISFGRARSEPAPRLHKLGLVDVCPIGGRTKVRGPARFKEHRFKDEFRVSDKLPMSKLYITLLAIAAFSISIIGATFSIAGLMKLFSGAAIAVALMASALEFAKLVSAGFLYRYWGHVNRLMRNYLSMAIVVLSAITSLGIFGFLSNAYQVSSQELKVHEIKLAALNDENARALDEIKRIQKVIDEVPRSRITKKFQMQKEAEPRIRKLVLLSDSIHKEIQGMSLQILDTKTRVGPLIYVAEATGADVDTVAKWLILIFVSVFDPLAICLVFATNLAIRLREKYRGNESKIAAHSLSTPVDHRFKKAS